MSYKKLYTSTCSTKRNCNINKKKQNGKVRSENGEVDAVFFELQGII